MKEKVDEKAVMRAVGEFKKGKLTQYQLEEKMRKLGVEYPSVILTQWELI
jgi:hypothetical protein